MHVRVYEERERESESERNRENVCTSRYESEYMQIVELCVQNYQIFCIYV